MRIGDFGKTSQRRGPSALRVERNCTCFLTQHIGILCARGVGIIVAALALSACAADPAMKINPPLVQPFKEIAPSEIQITPTKPEASAPKPTGSARPPVKPAPAESRNPEVASARAADPKDPSAGAIIIKVPATTGG